ncbi:MAG: cytochrome c3 family protein [Pseudomonadales bacterium]
MLACSVWSLPLRANEPMCAACHAPAAQALASQPHGRMGIACTACHGDGQQHLAAPGKASILGFSDEPASEQSAACAGCHAAAHPADADAHAAAGIACTACHAIHAEKKSPLNASVDAATLPEPSATCARCHAAAAAQFAHTENHVLGRAGVQCTSCHDPHAAAVRTGLHDGFDTQCESCHAEVAGPFVYEHGAVRVEGCGACHASHGSPNRHLLNVQEVGALCYTCHAEAPQFHVGFSPAAPPRFGLDTVCTNCHVAVHGSNLDRLLLK